MESRQVNLRTLSATNLEACPLIEHPQRHFKRHAGLTTHQPAMGRGNSGPFDQAVNEDIPPSPSANLVENSALGTENVGESSLRTVKGRTRHWAALARSFGAGRGGAACAGRR